MRCRAHSSSRAQSGAACRVTSRVIPSSSTLGQQGKRSPSYGDEQRQNDSFIKILDGIIAWLYFLFIILGIYIFAHTSLENACSGRMDYRSLDFTFGRS